MSYGSFSYGAAPYGGGGSTASAAPFVYLLNTTTGNSFTESQLSYG